MWTVGMKKENPIVHRLNTTVKNADAFGCIRIWFETVDEENMASQQIEVWQTKCKLCDEKIQGITKADIREALKDHVENKCDGAKALRRWEKEGIYDDMMGLLRREALEKDLKKILKYYSKEEIENALESMEVASV